MTKQQGGDLKIEKPEFYFRSFNGKRNFAPPAEDSMWYKFESIILRNTRSDFDVEGDNVGVATPWRYPQIHIPMITDADIRRALEAIRAGGPWRADQRSQREPWVGIPIANALTLDLLDARAKRAVAKIVQDWLRAGKLRVVSGRDRNREERDYVEAAVDE
jgi:hypothetical protein